MPATTPRVETFAVEDGHLVRKVVPRRGEPYEHRCPLDAYPELAWAAIDLAADGFTVETLADQVRYRPREEHDDREPWASYTNAAVANVSKDTINRRLAKEGGFFVRTPLRS